MAAGRIRRFLWRAVLAGLVLAAAGLGAVAGVIAAYLKDLPNVETLEEFRPSLVTTLYGDDDKPFASLFEQRRIVLPLAHVPARLQEALLATEDAHFYQHHGINPWAIARAMWVNLRAGHTVEGGSTITQQLTRVLFLTPERSFARKLKEALLALQIERRYSKDKILELYVNQIYLGHGAYGFEAAAQTYFTKSVGELGLGEAALIAGLASGPTKYSPILDPEKARRRRDHVLSRMAAVGYITPAEATAAAAEPPPGPRSARAPHVAPYFVDAVRQQVEERYGTFAVYHGGLKVYTTLNVALQRAAEDAVINGLREIDKTRGLRRTATPRATRPYPSYLTLKVDDMVPATVSRVRPRAIEVQVGHYRGEIPLEAMAWTKVKNPAEVFAEGMPVKVKVLAVNEAQRSAQFALEQDPEMEAAFLAIDPHTGGIKAMVGGYSFERSKFNRATQAKRQPGSAFKPFVYGAAFEQGLTPSTLLQDAPITFKFRVNGELVEWSPENYDRKYHGPTTLRRGLENSVNVMAVRLIQRVGADAVIDFAHRAGISTELRREFALALGASEVTLEDMVSAYGVFAAGGTRYEPYGIRRVADHQGRTLDEFPPQSKQALPPDVAFVLTNVMRGVVERGTGAKLRALNRPLAGKTGTTSEATDVWFVGFTPSLVAGVWVGYDLKRSLGPHTTSAQLAVPLWLRFGQQAFKDLPSEDFTPPKGVVELAVNPVTGRAVPPGDRAAIREYFLDGTEPGAAKRPALEAEPAPASAPAPASPPSRVPSPYETSN
jgi:penicillin-binding protein 1A